MPGQGATGPSCPFFLRRAVLVSCQREGHEGRPWFSSESKPPRAEMQEWHPPQSIRMPPPGLFRVDLSQGLLRAAQVKEP